MPVAARGGRGAGGATRRRRRPSAWPYLYVLPALLFAGVFVYWPLVRVVALSFFEWNLVSPDRAYVGRDNYAALFSDRDFPRLLWQTLGYVLLALVGNFLLPLGLATLTLGVADRHADLYQSLLFTPTVVATSVGALLWQWVYLPTGGLLNAGLAALGLPEASWLSDPDTALGAIGVVAAWKFLGFNYLIALAGLKAVPRDYLEAARVDGAGGWALLAGVVLPLLGPTVLFLALTTALQALPNAFVPIRVLTEGGPAGATSNLLYAVYQSGFQFFQVGRASAEAVVLMLLLSLAGVAYFRLLDRKLAYDR